MCGFHGIGQVKERPVDEAYASRTLHQLRIFTVRHLRLDWLSHAGRHFC
jgi:hypothetical protein